MITHSIYSHILFIIFENMTFLQQNYTVMSIELHVLMGLCYVKLHYINGFNKHDDAIMITCNRIPFVVQFHVHNVA